MPVPDGWQEWDPCAHGSASNNRPVQCGDCGWTGFEDDVQETIWQIDSLLDRVGPGEILPVGTCPEIHLDSKGGEFICRALVHYSDVEVAFRQTPGILDKIVEAINDVQ